MFNTAGDDDELAWLQMFNPVSKFDAKAALPDQKHLLCVSMAMPGKYAFDLDQANILTIQSSRDTGTPMVCEGGELVRKIDSASTRHWAFSSA